MRRIGIALAILATLAIAVLAWRCWGVGDDARRQGATAHRRTGRITLDVEAFRKRKAEQVRRAKALTARHAPAQDKPRLMRDFGRRLIEPACVLGPGELCAQLTELIAKCDLGGADACIALGQLLSDTPPRPLIAVGFFVQACRAGDARGCDRMEVLRKEMPSDVTCEDDPFHCAYRAQVTFDEAAFDEACSVGVADSCAMMITLTEDDPEASRVYVEAACQLGNPMACLELGRRLAPDCQATDEMACYPPDPDQHAAAFAIACEAGWTEAC